MKLALWQKLYDAVGGREALSAILEVNDTTVWRWARNASRPNSAMRRAVNDLCKKHGVDPVFGAKNA